MKDLTADRIREMFRDLGLETEEQRQAHVRLGSEPTEETKPSTRLFIRNVSSTAPEEEPDNAKLAQHP